VFRLSGMIAASGFLAIFGFVDTASAKCVAAPVYLYSARFESEGTMSVSAGKGCLFNLDGIPGAISEAKIVQQPKFGRAGVEGLKPFYMAKPGYTGPDEFSYAFIGTDQYGGPMRVVIKRKVTVIP
jgi:hypothetical protein